MINTKMTQQSMTMNIFLRPLAASESSSLPRPDADRLVVVSGFDLFSRGQNADDHDERESSDFTLFEWELSEGEGEARCDGAVTEISGLIARRHSWRSRFLRSELVEQWITLSTDNLALPSQQNCQSNRYLQHFGSREECPQRMFYRK
uniref:Uncharacterized protein n=1 Tax=Spongospora subterranea TaxID=70186 RepID=A0A0H5QJA7_9EUKA|eukprot:CRZ02195.1 hypothetical protein [Spongospora subterranea]